MTVAAVFEAVRARFADQVATPNALTVIQDNEPPPTLPSSWYRMAVLVDNAMQVATGPATARRYRYTGRAVVGMFTPLASGDAAALAVVDAVIAAFRGVVLSDPIIYFGVPTLTGPPERDGAWYSRVVAIPFEADLFG